MAQALRRAGYDVLVAANGHEAWELASRKSNDLRLILADVIMPRVGGPKLVREVRREQPDVRALYVSGYPFDATGVAPELAEGDALLSKPFAMQTLVAKVRAMLDR
jgi:DNA-binding response OmpR family regulator